MKHLVFLLGSYHPSCSAVDHCAHQVIKCLKKEFNITVIAQRSEPSLPLEEMQDGVRILRVESDDLRQRNRIRSGKSQLSSLRLNIIRARGVLRRLLLPETVDKSLARAYLNCLIKQPHNINAIVPVVFPIESVVTAMRYKEINARTQIIPYLFDDFVDSGSLHVFRFVSYLKRRRHLILERKMLEESYAILAMRPLRNHFNKWFSKYLTKKISYLEHPLLVKQNWSSPYLEDGVIRLCFAGSLIRNVREPGFLLQMLGSAKFKSKVKAEFFVMGNAAYQVKSGNVNSKLEVVNYGEVSKGDADEAVARSNILLNIGERTGRQISSKIFEYMASGKPIIHIAYTPDDSNLKILQKYPLVLCIIKNKDQARHQLRALVDFIEENCRSSIPYDRVANTFPDALPETTCKIFRAVLAEVDGF